jgi:hypothetical protein
MLFGVGFTLAAVSPITNIGQAGKIKRKRVGRKRKAERVGRKG